MRAITIVFFLAIFIQGAAALGTGEAPCDLRATCEFEYSCNDYLHACDNPGEKKFSWKVTIREGRNKHEVRCYLGGAVEDGATTASIVCRPKEGDDLRFASCVLKSSAVMKIDAGVIALGFGGMGRADTELACAPSASQPACRCPSGRKVPGIPSAKGEKK